MSTRPCVVMWLENNSYPGDGRVRREATALAGDGWEVHVVSPRGPGQRRRETVDGVSVHRYRAVEGSSAVAGFVAEFATALVMTALVTAGIRLRRPIEVIHAHNPPDFFAPLGWVFQRLGARFVFDHHDLAPEMYEARFGAEASPVLTRVLRWFEKLTFRVADRVVSTNESYRRVAIDRGGRDPASVTVVRNGPDLDVVRPRQPNPELASLGEPVLGYVGALGPQDGVDHLVRAIGTLVRDHELDVHCLVVGDGPARPDLEDLAVRLGVADRISFTGWLDTDDVMRALSSSDICIGPDPSNPYNDRSSMIKLSEYLALGKPVVAYDLPENRVTCGDAARYATPSDPDRLAAEIAALWHEPAARHQMACLGLERAASTLAWAHQVDALLSVYRPLAEGRR